MGPPFRSGHVLGLRRWTASSVAEAFTSVRHRHPQGRWTFCESTCSDMACVPYSGADVERVKVGAIGLEWEGSRRLPLVEATEPGPVGPLTEQTQMADFYLPQRGLFALGAVYVDTSEDPNSSRCRRPAWQEHHDTRDRL